MVIKVKTTGFRELERALLDLPKSTARGTARRAMVQALQPVLSAAQGSVPRGATGNLAAGLAISSTLNKNQARSARADRVGGLLTLYVGAQSPHAHLVEFGTGPRFHKSGKFVGVSPARPFLRPAWDGNAAQVLEILSAHLRVEIEKTLARAARRAARAGG
jgi:HK97 gp10 family phage protein